MGAPSLCDLDTPAVSSGFDMKPYTITPWFMQMHRDMFIIIIIKMFPIHYWQLQCRSKGNYCNKLWSYYHRNKHLYWNGFVGYFKRQERLIVLLNAVSLLWRTQTPPTSLTLTFFKNQGKEICRIKFTNKWTHFWLFLWF